MKPITSLRTLYILKLLETYSDETHPLSVTQLSAMLKDTYQLTAHRTTIYNDIASLQAFGVDIITIRSTQNLYFIGNRVLEIPELRLLMDAIHSSKCLTVKKSRELTDKLMTLVSIHQAKALQAHPFPSVAAKPKNEQIYYIIDAINAAIKAGKTIRFSYTEYTPQKELVLRGDGEIYTLSPYACVWSGDYYYVIGWSDKRRDVTAFRVDRIATTPEIGEENAATPPKDFDIDAYSNSVFQMYKGEETTVTLLCDNDTMKSVIDKFSEEVQTTVFDEERFTATVHASLSPTFYGWLFEFSGKIRLISPPHAKEDYKAMVQTAFEAL